MIAMLPSYPGRRLCINHSLTIHKQNTDTDMIGCSRQLKLTYMKKEG